VVGWYATLPPTRQPEECAEGPGAVDRKATLPPATPYALLRLRGVLQSTVVEDLPQRPRRTFFSVLSELLLANFFAARNIRSGNRSRSAFLNSESGIAAVPRCGETG
jgi:hypothetical protein